jgi:hypothetical protein
VINFNSDKFYYCNISNISINSTVTIVLNNNNNKYTYKLKNNNNEVIKFNGVGTSFYLNLSNGIGTALNFILSENIFTLNTNLYTV